MKRKRKSIGKNREQKDIGKQLFPGKSDSPRIARVVLDYNDDTDFVLIGITTDGRWFVSDYLDGVRLFKTPQKAFEVLWNNGSPGPLYVCALFAAGWLGPNTDRLRRLEAGEKFPTRVLDGWMLDEPKEVIP